MLTEKRCCTPLAVGLILSAAAAVASSYFINVTWRHRDIALALHDQIVAGTAASPYRFRVLVPYLVEGLAWPLTFILERSSALLAAYAIYECLAVVALLFALYTLCRRWFEEKDCLIGVLFVAATLSVPLRDHYHQPWSILEAALFACGVSLIASRRLGLMAVLMAVATLNRETAVFLAPMFLLGARGAEPAGRWPWGRAVGGATILIAIWAIVQAALRLGVGPGDPVHTVAEAAALNLAPGALARAAVNVLLFQGWFWILAVLGYRQAPEVIRSLAWVIPLYVAAAWTWGLAAEVRLLMPLYGILVPMGLGAMRRQAQRTLRDVSGRP